MSEQGGYEGEAAEPIEAPRPVVRPVQQPVRRRRAPRRPRATIGGILGSSFRVWARNVGSFLALTTLVLSPSIGLQVWLQARPPAQDVLMWWTAGIGALQWLLSLIVTGALIFGVFQDLRGRRASMGDVLARGLARLPAVLVVGIVVGVCAFLALLPGALLFGVGVGLLGPLGMVPGLLVMLLSGLVVYSGLYVAVPASVVEHPGVFGAVNRSWSLTQGYKLTLSVLLVLYIAASTVLGLVLTALTGMALGVASTLIEVAVTVLTTSVTAVFAGVAYHDIRVSKEGIGTEELAAIFD
jgi:hypothetical protein